MSGTSNISLNVIPKKKRGRLRWTILILVQVLILLHVGLWFIFGGETITPIEPSEGMEFVKNGVINAGAIFFALASSLYFSFMYTLVFGLSALPLLAAVIGLSSICSIRFIDPW